MKRNSLVYKDRLSVEDCEIVDLADGRGENKKKEKGNSSIFFCNFLFCVFFFSVKVPVKKIRKENEKSREIARHLFLFYFSFLFSFFFLKGGRKRNSF